MIGWKTTNSSKQQSGVAGNGVGTHTSENMLADREGTIQPVQRRWKEREKTALGRLKCNVDALFSDELNCVGHDMCIQDDTGNFVMAMWSNLGCSSDIGEALVLSHAIRWVRDLQLTNVDFELDAKKVVDYYNSGGNDIFKFGAIINECRKCCNSFFENSRLSLVGEKRMRLFILLHEKLLY